MSNHKEAFCLMQYANKDLSEREVLWNSRDGVTPFIILSKNGNEMQHINWNGDIFKPDFKPYSGMRIFVNATRELITPKLNEYIDKIWDDIQYPANKMWKTKQEAFDVLFPDWYHNGEAPWIVIVE